MSDEGSLEQQKREAAQKAKEAALKKLAEKQAQETDESTDPAAEKTKEELKKEAAQKAKEAAQKRLAEKQAAEGGATASEDDPDIAKMKAAAKAKAATAAKAKAAALAKQSNVESPGSETMDEESKAKAKAKAIAVAKAKAAAAAKAKATASTTADGEGAGDEKAKAIAAAKAKAAAAAAARAKTGADQADAREEQKPSPNQPYLDKYVKVINEHLSEVLEDSYINRISKDVPTLVAKKEMFYKLAEFLKYNEQLAFDYLSELHGTDYVTHMELYIHFYSYKNRQSVALKVKIDRDEPVIKSLALLWDGANWPEREAFDLLGIKFTGHPNLTRIMLPDDWVGYPLRKDYEPYDVEV
jgi:NADH-quinone oxidoreductase subunit C